MPQSPTAGKADDPDAAVKSMLRSYLSAPLKKSKRREAAASLGDAALALASYGDANDLALLSKLSRNSQPATAVPAILGLGVLATPGAARALGEQLTVPARSTSARTRSAAAAYALGLLPDVQSTPALDAFLHRVSSGSYSKNAQKLEHWLTALATDAHPERRATLRFLRDDPANRIPRLRNLADNALARILNGSERAFDTDALRAATNPTERLVLLAAVTPSMLDDEELLELTIELANDDGTAEVRAQALTLLIAARNFAALERATTALQSSHPGEAATGARAILRLGGHGMRRALEQELLSMPHDARTTQILESWDGRASNDFATSLYPLCRPDSVAEPRLQIASARILAMTGDARGHERLKHFIQSAIGDSHEGSLKLRRRALTAWLETQGDTPTSLDSLAPPSTAPDRHGDWVATLFAAAPELAARTLATDHVHLSQQQMRACIRALRKARTEQLERSIRSIPRSVLGSYLR